MKKTISLFCLSLVILISFNCSEKPQITEELKNSLRQDAKQFTESLKGILVNEMQTNGIIAAVSVCSDTAQTLTKVYGQRKGIQIKRVSLNNRNMNNIPDEFESKVLRNFVALKMNGQLDEKTEFFEVDETEDVKIVRYLKPIFIQAPCLSCHGADQNISTDVKAILNSKYPEDKATGYELNDLRGAVSITKTL